MAWTAQWWELTVQFVDRANKTADYKFRMVATDTAGDASTVLANALTVITAYAAASDCKIRSYKVGKLFTDLAFVLPTAATALNTVLAKITNQIHEHPTESSTYYIPGPKDLVFLATSGADADNVNFGQSEVDTIQDFYDIGGSNLLYISDGETNNENVHKGVRVTRKRTSP